MIQPHQDHRATIEPPTTWQLSSTAPADSLPSAGTREAATVAVNALLARIEQMTSLATTAATAGDRAQLSAAIAERDGLLADLGPLLRAAAGGAPLPEAVAAAVERQLGAIVERNLALRAIASDARARVIEAMHELQAATATAEWHATRVR